MLKLSTSLIILGQASIAWPSILDNGLLQTFQKDLKNYSKSKSKTAAAQRRQILPNNADIEITPDQLNKILFYLPEYYTSLVLNNHCSLYTFIKNDTIKIGGEFLKEIEVNILDKTTSKRTTAFIPIDTFKQYYFLNKCLRSKDIFSQYKKDSFKNTIENVSPKPPKNKVQCYKQWESWQTSLHTAQLCSVHERIKLAKNMEVQLSKFPNKFSIAQRSSVNSLKKEKDFYLENISDINQVYYKNLCLNLHNKESFCSTYDKQDLWTKILNFEEPQYKATWKCLALSSQGKMTKKRLEQCIAKIRSNDELCVSGGSNGKTNIFPMPTCSQTQKALLYSRLKTDYHDCPSKIKNNGITNFARILAHFGKTKMSTEPANCVFPSFATVFDMYKSTGEEDKWPLQICYADKLSKKESCMPFVPGNSKTKNYAQNRVVANILYKTRINQTRPNCNFISKSRYNPQRLSYKTGCWIIPKDEKCQTYNCPSYVKLDNRDVLDLHVKGNLSFDYMKNKYNAKDQSLIKRASELYQLKSKPVSSLTSARYFFDKYKSGIIQGVGCAQEFYPATFKTNSLGQCTPLPFIVSGYTKDGQETFFSFLSAIDDLHSPRIISWAQIFSAVSKYSQHHPLKNWNLNGIH